jgi:hypothetical protein
VAFLKKGWKLHLEGTLSRCVDGGSDGAGVTRQAVDQEWPRGFRGSHLAGNFSLGSAERTSDYGQVFALQLHHCGRSRFAGACGEKERGAAQ